MKKYILYFLYIPLSSQLTHSAQQARIHAKYIPLLECVDNLASYIHTDPKRKNTIQKFETMLTKARQDKYYLELAESSKATMVDKLYAFTIKLLQGEVDINYFLETLLKSRYEYLIKRTEIIQNYWLSPSSKLPFYPPTCPKMFAFLMKDKKYQNKEVQEINEKIRVSIIIEYNLLCQLIAKVFHLADYSELSPMCIKYLQAAVQLHPALKGLHCTDVGLPDEASGYGVIVPLLEEYYEEKCSPTSIISLCFYVAKEKENRYKKSEEELLERPDFKKYYNHLRSLDAKVYDAHLLFNYIEYNCAPGVISDIRFSDYDLGLWPFDLPQVDFLNKSDNKEDIELLPSFFENHPYSIASDTDKKTSDVDINKDKKKKSAMKKKKKHKVNPKCVEKNVLIYKTEKGVNNNNVVRKVLKDIRNKIGKKLPNGLEHHYIEYLEKTHRIPCHSLPLKGKHQRTINAIFDNQQAVKVPYRDIKSVWTAAGGSIIESKKGSHNVLKDQEGKTVGSTFAHGDNQTYPLGPLFYIRLYFLVLGCFPAST